MDKVVKAIMQNNYATYVQATNHGWIPSKFHLYLCNKIQAFIERESDNAYDILLINTPPQHGKSCTVTETLPSYYLCKNPYHKVIEISYSQDFSEQFGRRNNEKIAEFGMPVFGVTLAKQPNTSTEFELSTKNGDTHGGMISRGVMSGVTGHGANLLLIDDPVKTQKEADSESYRNSIWDEWNSSYKSRLAPHAKVIIIMTRWHEDDLAGRIIKNEKNVEIINLPCEAEENDPLGRKVGEALCPEIGKGDKWLKDFKEGFLTKEGSRTWNALYQGKPVSEKGNLLKREWWQYYTDLPNMVDCIMSVDATFKDGDDNDFVAIQVWGKRDANIYLIDAVKKHLNMPDTIREILRLKSMYTNCNRVLIEDKANGSAIIQVLRHSIQGVIPVEPNGGKVARVNAISGAIESGNVYLPINKPFTQDFVNECSSFPNGKHDDQVDAMSQALNRLIYFHSNPTSKKVVDSLVANFPMLKKKNVYEAIGRGEDINVI